MCEPFKRRTPCKSASSSSFHLRSPLVKALSLCGLFSVFSLSVLPVQAQEAATQYSVESPRAEHSLLLDVVNTGKRLVAVGDRGHVLVSDNNGQSWKQVKVPTRQLLTSMYFVDEQYGWAVGHDAQVLATTDGGNTWTLQYEDRDLEAPLLDVWFQDRDNGFAVGAYGALLVTTDGGETWEDASDRIDNEDAYHLNAIASIKDSGLFVVGEMGGMFRSSDGGESFEAISDLPYEGSLFGVMGTDQPGVVLAFGLRGNLFRSTDFGDSWTQVPVSSAGNGPLEYGLASGVQLADGTIVIVGNGGSVLRSEDGGKSFTAINRSDRLSLAGVAAAADDQLVVVGQAGADRTTANGTSLKAQ